MHLILRYRRMSGAIEINTTIIPTEANAKIALFILEVSPEVWLGICNHVEQIEGKYTRLLRLS